MYCSVDDVFRATGLIKGDKGVPSEGDVNNNILEAQEEIDTYTGTKWESTQVSETYDGTGDDELLLRHYPIISVDSLTINGTSVTVTTGSGVYIYTGVEGAGRIKLRTDAEETKFDDSEPQLVSITYTYGHSTVPTRIKRLTMCIAGIMTLVSQTGGTYNDLTSFSVPDFTGGLGEPWVNIKATVDRLKEEADMLMKHIKKLPAVG